MLISDVIRHGELKPSYLSRLSAFYLCSSIIGAFGPTLAYGLSLLNGKRGIAGWSWIFVGEGAISLALGILGYLFMPEFPDRNTFLTKAQTAFVLKRIEDDRGDAIADDITLRKILRHLGDWTIWAYGIMFTCFTLPTYMLAFFMPLILEGLGFSAANALLLSSPPYGAAFFVNMGLAWLSDKAKHRAGFIVLQSSLTLIGCCMTAFAPSVPARYAGTFFIAMGALGGVPSILAWGHNNVVSHSKRSVQSALTIAWGGIGGVLASTVFREKDAPKYLPGLYLTIAAQVLCIIMVGVLSTYFHHMNKLCREGRLSRPLQGQEGFRYTH
ncbi:hypothetical protein V5O48_012324 [Marasmius crinis-equi]|uniref:Major facilitator superfamily (MFS) profile domain-containing protein n=1 Tax=Marasmius crinis-equi TaxID=585013 RepID=A0ABR3F354_9AGAR